MKTPKKEEVMAVYQSAYETGDRNLMTALENLYGKEVFGKDITKHIRTFTDAYNMLGIRHPLVMSYIEWASPYYLNNEDTDNCDVSLRAFLKLRVIATALNGGWTPEFSDSEVRYSPSFWLLTEKEMDNLKQAYKRTHSILPVNCKGYACFSSANPPSGRTATIGSSFCFKTRELSDYCANQFIELWADLFGIRHD